MPKRVNYGFEKRQRELEKQKKNQKKLEEKAERRRLEKEASQPQRQSGDAPNEK
jgi:hypothetical protein